MLKTKPSIVLIDDEKDLLDSLKLSLESDFTIHPFTDPHLAMSFLDSNLTDAVVLDYHIPGAIVSKFSLRCV